GLSKTIRKIVAAAAPPPVPAEPDEVNLEQVVFRQRPRATRLAAGGSKEYATAWLQYATDERPAAKPKGAGQ
ncbi:MAG: hypothetical protein K0Q72_3127, partial [Armatimonadetes bacterium]|nr:hypothetical protein [Armatimonadota bacterium]